MLHNSLLLEHFGHLNYLLFVYQHHSSDKTHSHLEKNVIHIIKFTCKLWFISDHQIHILWYETLHKLLLTLIVTYMTEKFDYFIEYMLLNLKLLFFFICYTCTSPVPHLYRWDNEIMAIWQTPQRCLFIYEKSSYRVYIVSNTAKLWKYVYNNMTIISRIAAK